LEYTGFRGMDAAEHAAYLHEIMGAKRFGLTRHEVRIIFDTMNFWYPLPTTRLAGYLIGGN